MNKTIDKLATTDRVLAEVQFNNGFDANMEHDGVYTYTNIGPVEEFRDQYVALRDRIAVEKLTTPNAAIIAELEKELASIPTETKWEDALHNLITTVGKNNILDNHFSGSAYTAAWFVGLIDNASFTALAAADTIASHVGWIEFVGYSNATRIAPAWAAAAAGSKAFSTSVSFNINAAATLNGGFINSVSTKSGTTGVLCSEGSFAATRVVANGDTLNVSYTSTLT